MLRTEFRVRRYQSGVWSRYLPTQHFDASTTRLGCYSRKDKLGNSDPVNKAGDKTFDKYLWKASWKASTCYLPTYLAVHGPDSRISRDVC